MSGSFDSGYGFPLDSSIYQSCNSRENSLEKNPAPSSTFLNRQKRHLAKKENFIKQALEDEINNTGKPRINKVTMKNYIL
jgi:hypothetical protein